MHSECIGCGGSAVKQVIDLGLQPPSNRYLEKASEDCEAHELVFGYCTRCGLGQLLKPMASNVVRSRYSWITYNEPEGHLDDLVSKLRKRLPVSENTKIIGVTYKDDSTLARFNRSGVPNTYRLNQLDDLGIEAPLASLESIQYSLVPGLAEELSAAQGPADLLLVRHILEHAHRPRLMLEACRKLVKQGGLLVFEVPDCCKVLNGHDHCFLWEEHISYFTPETLKGFLVGAGFNDVEIIVYPYPMEDSLIAIARNDVSEGPRSEIDLKAEISRIEEFAGSYLTRGSKIRKHLQRLQADGKRVALFGAGHLAAKFINFYGLSPYLIGVIDDNQHKLGRLMPGSKLPIIGSSCLENGDVDLCLLTLNPESEQKVLKARAEYLTRGGKFRSIFSASANSIDLDVTNA